MKALFVLAFMLGAVIGCSSGFACGERGHCPKDTDPSQASIDACNAEITGPCKKQAQAYYDCVKNHSFCTLEGNSAFDGSKCTAENDARTKCLAGN